MLVLHFLFLFVSIFVLVKSADYFTVSAEKIGLYFGLPPFIVGVTIVSIGTSLPELLTSIFAILQHESPIVAGNVVGSNIANIFLVLGFSTIVAGGFSTRHDVMKVDLPMAIASALFLYVASYDGVFDYKEGIISLLALFVYMLYAAESKNPDVRGVSGEFKLSTIAVLILSLLFLNFSAKYTVMNIIDISTALHLSTGVIAASVVAVGTSLPELMVSLSAAKKRNFEMAIGNVIGSNIFNTFGIMGVASLVGTLKIDKSTLSLSMPVMVVATILLVFSLQNRAMSRWMGYIFIIFYLLYMLKLFA